MRTKIGAGIEYPPLTTGEQSLSEEEYNKVIAVIDNLEDMVLIKLAVNTGMRRLDISKIEINNINLTDREITYYEHKKDRGVTIPIAKSVAQLIEMHLNIIIPTKRKYLFSFGSSKYGDKTAYNRFNRLLKNAGLPERSFHALRSTCYKFCQRDGWSPAEAAKLLGDSIRVAQEHYETPSKAELREKQENREI